MFPHRTATMSRTLEIPLCASSKYSSPVRLRENKFMRPQPILIIFDLLDKFEDVSLGQWLALTPPELVKAHLQLSDDTIAKLNTTKVTVAGSSNA